MAKQKPISAPCVTCQRTRRGVLKFLAAIPLIGALVPMFSNPAGAAGGKKVAKLSQLAKPWSTVSFRYKARVSQTVASGKEVVGDENIPGIVIRLPDDIAAKRGGGEKAKYAVIDLHCSHRRCETNFISDTKELYAITGRKFDRPVILCPCHFSIFEIDNGLKPAKGARANKPLAEFLYKIEGGEILVTGLPKGASEFGSGRLGSPSGEYAAPKGSRGL